MSGQVDMFGGGEKPEAVPLKDPKEVIAEVLVDVATKDAVYIESYEGAKHWVPRQLIRFDGKGSQRLKIEKWKAEELGL